MDRREAVVVAFWVVVSLLLLLASIRFSVWATEELEQWLREIADDGGGEDGARILVRARAFPRTVL